MKYIVVALFFAALFYDPQYLTILILNSLKFIKTSQLFIRVQPY